MLRYRQGRGRLNAVACTQYAPLRIEVPSEATYLAHTIEALLTKLLLESCSFTPPISSGVFLPTRIRLPSCVQWTHLPVGVDRSSQSRVFKSAWKTKPVAIELLKPYAFLILRFAKASSAQLTTVPHCAAGTGVLGVEVDAPGLGAVLRVFAGAQK